MYTIQSYTMLPTKKHPLLPQATTKMIKKYEKQVHKILTTYFMLICIRGT